MPIRAGVPAPAASAMLTVRDLAAGYGMGQVLQGVSFQVAAGELVAVLGRNGAGRSTLAKAIMGQVSAQGSINWCGHELVGKKTFQIARLGLGYVPESRDVFADLTVAQNLALGQKPGASITTGSSRGTRWQPDDIYRLFPQLGQRQQVAAGVLSGGEQQMLALGRTLLGNPTLMLIDEPTEGLAPQVIAQLGQFLAGLKNHGIAVLLIEQKLNLALAIADRCLVFGGGRVVADDTPAALQCQRQLMQEWLAL